MLRYPPPLQRQELANLLAAPLLTGGTLRLLSQR